MHQQVSSIKVPKHRPVSHTFSLQLIITKLDIRKRAYFHTHVTFKDTDIFVCCEKGKKNVSMHLKGHVTL